MCNIRNLVHLADDAYRYGSLDKISAFSLKSSCRNLKAWYVNLHFLFNKLSEGCQKVHIVQKLSKTCWPILKGGGGGHQHGPVPEGFGPCSQYSHVQIENYCITLKENNRCVRVNDNISIVFFLCINLSYVNNIFKKKTLESGLLEINKVSELSDELKLKFVY